MKVPTKEKNCSKLKFRLTSVVAYSIFFTVSTDCALIVNERNYILYVCNICVALTNQYIHLLHRVMHLKSTCSDKQTAIFFFVIIIIIEFYFVFVSLRVDVQRSVESNRNGKWFSLFQSLSIFVVVCSLNDRITLSVPIQLTDITVCFNAIIHPIIPIRWLFIVSRQTSNQKKTTTTNTLSKN